MDLYTFSGADLDEDKGLFVATQGNLDNALHHGLRESNQPIDD